MKHIAYIKYICYNRGNLIRKEKKMTQWKSLNSRVTDCYLQLKHADEVNADPTPILRRYGKETRDLAMEKLKEEYKNKYNQ